MFGPYFTDRYHTPWGKAINYDGPDSDPVRQFVVDNACAWVRDFHVDGLRLDAVHTIYDLSARHVLAEIQARRATGGRHASPGTRHRREQSERHSPVRLRRERGGYGLDGVWSDDFHHAVHSLLTGERDGYYLDFGRPEQLAKAFHDVFVYDGCYSQFRHRRHGSRVGADRPDAVRRLRAEPRPGGESGTRRSLRLDTPVGGRNGWPCGCCCSRLACRCCSWARNTASNDRSPSSVPSATRRSSRPCAVGDAGSSPRWLSSGEWRFPIRKIPETFAAAKLSWAWPEGSRTPNVGNCTTCLTARRQWSALRDRRQTVARLAGDGSSTNQNSRRQSCCSNGAATMGCWPWRTWLRRPCRLRAERGDRKLLMTTEDARYGGARGTQGTAPGASLRTVDFRPAAASRREPCLRSGDSIVSPARWRQDCHLNVLRVPIWGCVEGGHEQHLRLGSADCGCRGRYGRATVIAIRWPPTAFSLSRGRLTFRDAAAVVPYLDELGISHLYASPYLKVALGQHARLRGRRLRPTQPGTGQPGRLPGDGRGPARPRDGPDPRHRAEPHERDARARTPGGTTCWRTGPARPTPPTSTSTGGRSRRNCGTGFCCRFWATSMAQVLESGDLKLEYRDGALLLCAIIRCAPAAGTADLPHDSDLPAGRRSRRRCRPTPRSCANWRASLTALEHLPECTRPSRPRGRAAARKGGDQGAAPQAAGAGSRGCRVRPPERRDLNGIARTIRTATTSSTSCSTPRSIGFRTGRRPPTKSTTGDSSTSTNWRPSARRTPAVFAESHRLVFELLVRGDVDGLRIDHIDGLYDPMEYLRRLQAGYLRALGKNLYQTLGRSAFVQRVVRKTR